MGLYCYGTGVETRRPSTDRSIQRSILTHNRLMIAAFVAVIVGVVVVGNEIQIGSIRMCCGNDAKKKVELPISAQRFNS